MRELTIITSSNYIEPIIQEGKVWVPENRWAEELMEEVTDFPNGEHDDLVDSTTLALIRFRNGGFLRLDSDYDDEEEYYPKVRAYY